MTDRNAARSATENMLYKMEQMHNGQFYERSLVAMVRLVSDCGYSIPKAYVLLKLRPRMFQLWSLDVFGMKPSELIHRLAGRKPVKTLKHFEVAKYVQLSPEIVRKIVPSQHLEHSPELFEGATRWLFGALRADGTGMMILTDGRPCWFNYAITDPADFVELIASHPLVYKEIEKRNLSSLVALISE